MVNGIGSNNVYAYPKQDLENLARYATGMDITPQSKNLTVSELTSYPATLTLWESYNWIKSNKGNYKAAFKTIANKAQDANKILKQSGVNGVLMNNGAKEILSYIPQTEILSQYSKKTQDLYNIAQTYAQQAARNPKNAKGAIKVARQKFAEAKAAAYAETAKNATGILGKVKNALGITKVNKGLNNLAAKSPVFSKCLDAYRNESGTIMLLLEGGAEAVTNVVPTFRQLGAKKGFKQLGKSTVTTASSVAGWVAGSAIGSKLGTIAKAAVGGKNKLGTLVGVLAETVCSYIGGTIGQHFATKAANKVVGKSELEKAKDEQARAIAQEAQNNPELMNSLVEATVQRYAAEGEDSPNAKAINESFKNIVASQQASPMLNREQLAAVAKSLEDPQVQQTQQVNAKAQTSDRATQALNNADAYMEKISKTLLK